VDTAPGPDPGEAETEPGDAVASEVGGQATDPSATDPADPSATDSADDDPGPHDPLRFNHWMKRSAAGAVLSGIALGLQQALEEKRELPAFVMEAPGEPEDPDAPITLHFDPDDPTKTVAVIRPQPPTGHADVSDVAICT
jgi:hypothetical protein